MRVLNFVSVGLISFSVLGGAFAAEDSRMREDNKHVRTWTGFADDTLALHHELIKKHEHEVKKSLGGYAENKDFYIEMQHISKKTGKLLSLVQWEKEKPDVMHSVEVYIHDDKGRIVRDYMAAYLPGYHNAPVQTLISFHQYKDKLHGFRSFDASGDLLLERCEGEYQGKSFEFLLDEDDLYAAYLNGNPIEEKVYNLCIGDLPTKIGKYIKPQ